jgi:hypothetical protein
MSRLKDFARSIQTFRVDFSALVLSTCQPLSDDGQTDDNGVILLKEKGCFGDTFIPGFEGVLIDS